MFAMGFCQPDVGNWKLLGIKRKVLTVDDLKSKYNYSIFEGLEKRSGALDSNISVQRTKRPSTKYPVRKWNAK